MVAEDMVRTSYFPW